MTGGSDTSETPIANAFPRGSQLDEIPQLTCLRYFNLLDGRLSKALRVFERGLDFEVNDVLALGVFHEMSIILATSVCEVLAPDLPVEEEKRMQDLLRYRHVIVHEVGATRTQVLDERFFRSKGINWLKKGHLLHPLTHDQINRKDETVRNDEVEPVTPPAPRSEGWESQFRRIVESLRYSLQMGSQYFRRCALCVDTEAMPSSFKRADCRVFGKCRTKDDFRYPCGNEWLQHRQKTNDVGQKINFICEARHGIAMEIR